jgi:peptide-methionine (S)-S-oxide reductase
MKKIGFGGGCHWCTEAVFQSLKGVRQVDQGWIKSVAPYDSFSEAVVVHFRPEIIDYKTLIEIHLLTHSSTSEHRMRPKYRSAIYFFTESEQSIFTDIVFQISQVNQKNYIPRILPFAGFKFNKESYLSYYQKNPEKAFCKTYIHPKLKKLQRFYPDKTIPDSKTIDQD